MSIITRGRFGMGWKINMEMAILEGGGGRLGCFTRSFLKWG